MTAENVHTARQIFANGVDVVELFGAVSASLLHLHAAGRRTDAFSLGYVPEPHLISCRSHLYEQTLGRR
jgi:hypothetical protein